MYCIVCSAYVCVTVFFFFSSRRRHTRLVSDWSSDVCSSDLTPSYALNFRDVERIGWRRAQNVGTEILQQRDLTFRASAGDRHHGAAEPFRAIRSEERRVGKEGRCRWAPYN